MTSALLANGIPLVAEESFARLVTEIAAWLEERRPTAVLTFGPHRVTGHPDHVP